MSDDDVRGGVDYRDALERMDRDGGRRLARRLVGWMVIRAVVCLALVPIGVPGEVAAGIWFATTIVHLEGL